jgi:hypothetical protein
MARRGRDGGTAEAAAGGSAYVSTAVAPPQDRRSGRVRRAPRAVAVCVCRGRWRRWTPAPEARAGRRGVWAPAGAAGDGPPKGTAGRVVDGEGTVAEGRRSTPATPAANSKDAYRRRKLAVGPTSNDFRHGGPS